MDGSNDNNHNDGGGYDIKYTDEVSVVNCTTTKGDIGIEFYKAWSPSGYERCTELFDLGYYDNSHFFRMVPGFLVQFGISYNQSLHHYNNQPIIDDPVIEPTIPFIPGTLSYAGSGPNSRTTQLFIAFGPGRFGVEKWETPLGRVTSGLNHVHSFYSKYGDMPPWGNGPVQQKIHNGPQYIENNFPEMDQIIHCTVKRYQPIGNNISPFKIMKEEDEQEQHDGRELMSTDHVQPQQHLLRIQQQLLSNKNNNGDEMVSTTVVVPILIIMIVLGVIYFLPKKKVGKKN